MESRKEKILSIIIKEYIKTAEPVGSSLVTSKYKLPVSSATVRNEMSELEREGYIYQPHTSAGRIPSELGYLYYLDNLKTKELCSRESKDFDKVLNNFTDEDLKNTAKCLAKNSNQAVFWAFHKNSFYYTGISNLFKHPEFSEQDLVQDVSLIIDRMEDIIANVFDDISNGIEIFIGEKNPFGNVLSTLTLKYNKDKTTGIVGILGPTRMDYEKNLVFLKYLDKKLNF
ncbi:hypothetical protein EOL94_02720 [bacterium]|nr:hypothetical protein [bacterium]